MADPGYAYKSITAQNTYSDSVRFGREGGQLLVEDVSSFVGTVTLQARASRSADWTDVDSFTGEGGCEISGGPFEWRAGVKTGDYTSGTVAVHVRKNG
jgi:hypothetical protein